MFGNTLVFIFRIMMPIHLLPRSRREVDAQQPASESLAAEESESGLEGSGAVKLLGVGRPGDWFVARRSHLEKNYCFATSLVNSIIRPSVLTREA